MKYVMWFLIVPLMAGLILTNCKKDDEDPEPTPVDFTTLDAKITEVDSSLGCGAKRYQLIIAKQIRQNVELMSCLSTLRLSCFNIKHFSYFISKHLS